MTAPSTSTTVPMDEELLIQEAIRQRRFRRSRKSLAGAAMMVVLFGAVGFLLVVHPGVITGNVPYSDGFLQPVLIVIGVAAFLVAALLVVGTVSGARLARSLG